MDTGARMTPAALQKIALEQANGYATPSLNDNLFLSFKGYRKVESLEAYTGLKALYAESNGFAAIEGLSEQRNLRSLYLKGNLISKIEGLDNLQSLVTLDLSENSITKIEGLSSLPNLSTLNIAKNALKDVNSIRHLAECKALTAVDLSNNCISTAMSHDDGVNAGNDEDDDMINLLSKCHGITSLNLAGNPVANEISHFRKKLIVALKSVKYVDRPVFDQERAMAEAWAVGGHEAEARAKKEWQEKERKMHRQGLQDFRQWQERMREEAEARPSDVREVESEARARQKEQRLAAAQEEVALEHRKYALEVKQPMVVKQEEEVQEETGGSNEDGDYIYDDDDDDDEGPPPLTDSTITSAPAAIVGMETIGIGNAKIGDLDDIKDGTGKDSTAEEPSVEPSEPPSVPPVSLPETNEAKDAAALIQESLEILRKQKESIRLAKDTDSGFSWSDELDLALIRHATATGFDPKETMERLSEKFPMLAPSLDESLLMQRLGVLGLIETKSAEGNDQGQNQWTEGTSLPTETAIPLLAGKKELPKSSSKHLVRPPAKLPSSREEGASDLDASFEAFLEKLDVLAVESGVEDANETNDSDVFFDARETLSPTK